MPGLFDANGPESGRECQFGGSGAVCLDRLRGSFATISTNQSPRNGLPSMVADSTLDQKCARQLEFDAGGVRHGGINAYRPHGSLSPGFGAHGIGAWAHLEVKGSCRITPAHKL